MDLIDLNLDTFFSPLWATLGVPAMTHHYRVMFLAAIAWQALYLFGRFAAKRWIPEFRNWSKHTQRDFGSRIVAFTNAVLMVILAIPIFSDPVLKADKLFGYSKYAADVYAIFAGYFIWDIYVSLQSMDIGFILHAFAAFFVFFYGFTPFVMYYGATFLMYELSTPFLNIHWMCDKLGLTGSTLQLVNGILLLAVFFGARICFGLYSSYAMFADVFQNLDRVPVALSYFLLSLNILLNALNVYWFYKMVDSVRRRFAVGSKSGSKGTKADDKKKAQ
ncbi:hypothetical protein HDU98_001077 [Podochytrium sp. JEL0797]|nr:hypothetical protein HDU98_001077 [Podochytrium sp. JEL0797]